MWNAGREGGREGVPLILIVANRIRHWHEVQEAGADEGREGGREGGREEGREDVPLVLIVANRIRHWHDVEEAGTDEVREPLTGGGGDALREGGRELVIVRSIPGGKRLKRHSSSYLNLGSLF